MSGVHLTVEESIKLNMMRYFNCSELNDITLVNPRKPESPLLSGFERIIDVVYKGTTRTIGYDRFNVTKIFLNAAVHLPYLTLGEDIEPTPELVYPFLHGAYGIDIPESEIDYEATNIDDGINCVFVMKEDSSFYKGSLAIRVKINKGRGYPTPLHEWLLMGDLRDSGTAKTPMTAPFKFVDKDTGRWATLTGGKTPQAFGPGIELPTDTNWTLDFEFMVTSVGSYNSVLAETVPGGYVPGSLCFYYGALYEAYLTHGVHGMKLVANVPSRHTLVCKNNIVNYYFNGTKVETWNTQTTRKAWRGFRNTATDQGQFDENISHIRKLRSWDITLEGTDLDKLFMDEGPALSKYPIPDHEWLLNGKFDNTGLCEDTITEMFKFVTLPSGQWATLTGGRTPQRIGPTVKLDRTGDWCVDFEMLVTQTPIRNTVFQSGLDNFTGNTLMFYANAMYIPYGNSSNLHTFVMPVNVPTRHTLRCVKGVIYYYMDGLLAQSFNNPGTGEWTYFRSTFSETEQMEEDKTFLRNIRFWRDGMSDSEFTELLYTDTTVSNPPVHHWPLAGTTENIGSSPTKPAFAPPVAFSMHTDGLTMANLTSPGNHPLGTTFNAAGDWTIAARVVDPTPGLKGFITAENSTTYGVSSNLYMSKLSTYLSTAYSNNWYTSDSSILMQPGKRHSLVMTKRGPSYRMYVDGVMVQRVSATNPVVGLFSHFGAYNSTASLDKGVKFSDMRIYDYGMSLRQVHEYVNEVIPDTPYPLPDHEWRMNGTAANTGKQSNALAAPVKYKTIADKQYATFTSNQLIQRFGVNLATTLNWTLDIEILYTALSEYEHFMAGETSAGQTGVYKFFNGKIYEAYCNQSATPPAFSAGVPVRLTMVCKNGTVSYYQNKNLVSTWPVTPLANRPALTGFGSLANMESHVQVDKFHFRNFRYYDRALTQAELDTVFRHQ